MTTMDAVRHFGGSPANFMEIGGESYTKAKPGAGAGSVESARQMPACQFLRRVRPH
jgi:succinyl-CoA synthetase beta subunit